MVKIKTKTMGFKKQSMSIGEAESRKLIPIVIMRKVEKLLNLQFPQKPADDLGG